MDLSADRDLIPLAEVVRDVVRAAERAEAPIFIAGAVSRDLWLWRVHRIAILRATADLDFAVRCETWEQFERFGAALAGASFERPDAKLPHRFRHRHGTLVDLLPFGGVERRDRTIAWPPDGGSVMNLLGFREVLDSAIVFQLPDDVEVPVVSLPSLAALKLLAWQDRRIREPGKDAFDLNLILEHYSDAGNAGRMFEEIPGLHQRGDYDFVRAGAELLGLDLAANRSLELKNALRELLELESDPSGELRLARDMRRGDEESARTLLEAVLLGLKSRR